MDLEPAAHETLAAFGFAPQLAPALLDDADGLALLALLANAGAKTRPALYRHKAALVGAACRAAARDAWWVDQHRYARAGRWPWLTRLNSWWHRRTRSGRFGASVMRVVFIETRLRLDDAPLQVSFHFPAGEAWPELDDPPPPAGRRWRGQRAQARAQEVAAAWFAERGMRDTDLSRMSPESSESLEPPHIA